MKNVYVELISILACIYSLKKLQEAELFLFKTDIARPTIST